MSSASLAIERAREARLMVATVEAEVQREQDKLASMLRAQASDQQDRERLRAEEDRDAAIRLVDGEDAAPRKTRRVNRLAALDETVPAHAAAIQIQRGRIADIEASATAPRPHFVAAILDLVEEVQGDALEAIRSRLAELREPLARLIAADQVRIATIGDRFSVPTGRSSPFSGLAVIRNFAKALPARLTPPELAEISLFDAAHDISSAIISSITKES